MLSVPLEELRTEILEAVLKQTLVLRVSFSSVLPLEEICSSSLLVLASFEQRILSPEFPG